MKIYMAAIEEVIKFYHRMLSNTLSLVMCTEIHADKNRFRAC